MADQPIDLEAVRRVDTKIDQVLAAYPELQEVNPERLQALEERLEEEDTMTEYVTMLARVPAELADLVKRYAAQHGQIPVSELIREGLEWRIGDGDPRGTGLYLDEPVGIREREDTSNTDRAEDREEGLRSMVLDLFAEVRRYREEVRASGQHSSVTQAADGELPAASMKAQSTLGQAPAGEDMQEGIPPYDPAKRKLGKLCPGEHEWGTTGQTLLRLPSLTCPLCEAASKRDRRKAKRQAQPVVG